MWAALTRTCRAVIRALTADASLGQVVTYRHVVGVAYDPAAQTAQPIHLEVSLRALVGPVEAEAGPAERPALGLTKVNFLISRSDLGPTPMPGDQIVWAGLPHEVLKVTADRGGAAYRIVAERR